MTGSSLFLVIHLPSRLLLRCEMTVIVGTVLVSGGRKTHRTDPAYERRVGLRQSGTLPLGVSGSSTLLGTL